MRLLSLRHGPRHALWLVLPLALSAAGLSAFRRGPVRTAVTTNALAPQPGAEIMYELRSFRVMATVLHVAAHPDDENTQLIAYLARGRAYRTGYLSLTRGDGGQNLLGPELGEKLGVARTQELLAARRLDGGRQFFTRALDFGFSKDYEETLSIWDHQQVLSDVVRVIRLFRPDVIVTRFSTVPGNTHGHHTASAVIALEAFKLAGDPTAFPEQLKTLTPWQPKRIFMNAAAGGRGDPGGGTPDIVHMDISGTDPVLDEPFATVAAQSRAMHKTQGFGQAPAGAGAGGSAGGGAGGGGGAAAGGAGAAGAGRGGGGGRAGGGGGTARLESFTLLAGDSAKADIMDGIDTTWSRVAGGAAIGPMVNDVMDHFNAQDPSASVPALLAIRTRLAPLPHDPVLDDKRRLLDHIIQECLGVVILTTVPQAEVVPGETLHMHHTVTVRASIPVRWTAVRYPDGKSGSSTVIALRAGETATREGSFLVPANTPLSMPYWLRQEQTAGMFVVSDASLIGQPESPPAFPLEEVFDVGGQTITIPDEPLLVTTPPAGATPSPASSTSDRTLLDSMLDQTLVKNRRRVDVISPAPLRFVPEVGVFAPGSHKAIVVEVTAARANTSGTLRLKTPAGWQTTPASQAFRLAGVGDQTRLSFTVTAPGIASSTSITAVATVNGAAYDNQRIAIQYAHIPIQLLQPPARLKAISFNVATRGHTVGYVPGAGDDVAAAIEQLGYAVTPLTGTDLTPERLKGFDAVVLGIRTFNVRTDMSAAMPALTAYVEAGGTVIEQYNQPTPLRATPIAPFPLTLTSTERVTDENATVTFLAPDHPALNVPNKITTADFSGWVQEQGSYYPSQWDSHYTPILASSDPGEAPLKGGLLIAQDGRGYFVYTGLVFFRQLPAGVPGAYRLFANLLSLGK